MKSVLILGGYGNAGFLISKYLLLETSDVSITIAGRRIQKAEVAVKKLNESLPGNRASALQVDVTNLPEFRGALNKSDLVVMASSTLKYIRSVAQEVIKAGVDYLDIQLSSPLKLEVLYSLEDTIKTAGLCFVTDGGFHPGVPAALVRYAADLFDELQVANIFGGLKVNWAAIEASEGTMEEMLEEFRHYSTLHFKDGKWQKMNWFAMPPKYNFREPLGNLYVSPMLLEEHKFLPKMIPSLKETGFYISGFNPVMDYFILPFILIALKFRSRFFESMAFGLFKFGMKFSKPPYGVRLVADCKGIKSGQQQRLKLILEHGDEYLLTAVPTVACLLQLLDGSIKKPGLWFQANAVEPKRFLDDMARMGLVFKIEEGWE